MRSRGGRPPAVRLQLLALDWPPTSPTGPLGCFFLLLFSGARLFGAALFGLSYSSGQGFNLYR
uniref:Uncharacterized protein n=1 Tax=Zea mays TaxID=4577 RepID=B6T1X8_MAIZE|nr:hypothetical protein [Zea mays]